MTSRIVFPTVCMVVGLLSLIGCAQSYSVPGGPVDFRALGITEEVASDLTDISITRRLERRPLAGFPTSIAVVRVQDRDYRSYSARGYGSGSYTVVSVRDVESDGHFQQIRELPMVRGVAPLNRLVLPAQLNSDLELRQGAATVQADMPFIYTFDTIFNVEEKIPPLGIITLGLFPDEEARVATTASGALMDTRNGYVYGLVEASSQKQKLTNAWASKTTVDQVRRQAEAEAFDQLVAEFVALWPDVVRRYGPPEQAAAR